MLLKKKEELQKLKEKQPESDNTEKEQGRDESMISIYQDLNDSLVSINSQLSSINSSVNSLRSSKIKRPRINKKQHKANQVSTPNQQSVTNKKSVPNQQSLSASGITDKSINSFDLSSIYASANASAFNSTTDSLNQKDQNETYRNKIVEVKETIFDQNHNHNDSINDWPMDGLEDEKQKEIEKKKND